MFSGCSQSEVKRQEGICQLTTVVQSPLGGHHLNGERWGQLPKVLLLMQHCNMYIFTCNRYLYVCNRYLYVQHVFFLQLTTVVQLQRPLGGHHLNGERWGQLPRVLLPVQHVFTCSRFYMCNWRQGAQSPLGGHFGCQQNH